MSIGGKYPGSNIAINNVYFLDLLQEPYIWVPTTPMISCRKDFTVCVNEKRIFAVSTFKLYYTNYNIRITFYTEY